MELDLKNYESSVFVISAPSGVGKTSLRKILLSSLQNFYYSISFTTRPPRAGEVNGQDYFFVSKEVFQEQIKNQALIEWAEVHQNFYGTPKEPIETALRDKKDVLLDIDVQGVRKLQSILKGAILIFLLPPSWEILEERLRSRKTETDQQIANRLKVAFKEIRHCWEYDYLIVNNTLEEAAEKVKAIISGEHCRPAKMKFTLKKFL